MLLLAVDTSGKNGSLALVRLGESLFDVLELVPLLGRMYSAQMIPELQGALARHNLKKTDIDAYVVASGPGSFTGLRVGLSTAKALSEVLHKPIAAVSVLEATARMAKVAGAVIVALDAGRKQVFAGEYEFGWDFEILRANESLVSFEGFFNSVSVRGGSVFSPDRTVRDAAATYDVEIGEIAAPQADMFARIGHQKILRGETTPAELLEANYIRASDAELFSLPKLMP